MGLEPLGPWSCTTGVQMFNINAEDLKGKSATDLTVEHGSRDHMRIPATQWEIRYKGNIQMLNQALSPEVVSMIMIVTSSRERA